jgi:transcriptional regulator with XRE-family HTH domain
MENILGDIIYESRKKGNLTQDQFGMQYSVSGPAIFKFEKGFINPSLELWLRMAADAEIPQRRAILLWTRRKLPEQFQQYIELQAPAWADAEVKNLKRGKKADYSKFENHEQMRKTLAKDKALPKTLRDLFEDDDIWTLFRPTGHEINMLRDTFAPLGKGSKQTFREALLLIREFSHSF